MSSPEATAVLPDQAPAVPPPSSRKPTASEKADEALARLTDLERLLEQGGTIHPDIADSGTAPTLTAEQAAALEKVPALDGDLDALGQALNELSTRVDNLPATGSADGDKARFDEMARAFAQLQENVRATLSEVRAVVDPNVEVTEALEHVRQEQGSYGRALDALTGRLAEVENRQTTGAQQRPRADGAPARPLVLGAVLRLMRRVPELGKSKQAPSSAGGFKFRGIEAVMDAIGSAMREDDIGLIMRTEVVSRDITRETIKDRTWTSTDLVIRYVFVHPEDGSEHAFEMAGEGRDLGDKASSKAASMAAKYALCQALMIPFNGMADSDADDPATQQAQQHAPADDRDQEARELARQDYEAERAREAQRGQQQVARDAQQSPTDEPEDQRSPEERAAAVVAALERLNTFPLEEARGRFDRIASAATTQGLTGLIVEGSNIALHLQVHRTLLERAAAAASRG